MGLPWGSPHTAPSLLSVPSLSPLGMQGTSWDSPGGPLTQLCVPSLSPLGRHGTPLGVPSHSTVPTVRPIPKSPRDAWDYPRGLLTQHQSLLTSWDYPRCPLTQHRPYCIPKSQGRHGTPLGVPSHSSP